MSIPESLHPDVVRAELAAAERRAQAKIRRGNLIRNGIIGVALIAVAVFAVLLLQSTNQIKKQNKVIVAQGQTISTQTTAIAAATKAIADLQKAQIDSSATGRATQLQVAGLVQQIAGFTDPNTPQAQERAKATAQILAQLAAANQAALSDQLRKEGELAQCAPCSPAQVSKILAEPVPVPTFSVPNLTGGTPKPSSGSAKATSVSSASQAPALKVQVQCLVVCPSPTP